MQRQKYKIIIFGCAFTCWQFASGVNADTEFLKMLDCTEIELEAVIDQDASRKDNLARLSKQFFQSVNTIDHCNRAQNRDDAAPSTEGDSVSSNISANQASASGDTGGTANSTASINADAENARSIGNNAVNASSKQMKATLDKENSTSTDVDNSTTGSSTGDMAATQSANQLDSQSSGQSESQTTRPAAPPSASGSLVGTNFDQTITETTSSFAAPSASNMTGTTPQTTPAEPRTTGGQTDTANKDRRLTNGKTPDDIPDADNDSVFETQIRAAATAETDPDTKKNLWNEYRRYKGLPEQK